MSCSLQSGYTWMRPAQIKGDLSENRWEKRRLCLREVLSVCLSILWDWNGLTKSPITWRLSGLKKQNSLVLDKISGSRGKEAGDEARDKIEPNSNPDPQASPSTFCSAFSTRQRRHSCLLWRCWLGKIRLWVVSPRQAIVSNCLKAEAIEWRARVTDRTQRPDGRWEFSDSRTMTRSFAPWNWLGTNRLEANHHNGKEYFKEVYICIDITGSLCCTAEINTIL